MRFGGPGEGKEAAVVGTLGRIGPFLGHGFGLDWIGPDWIGLLAPCLGVYERVAEVVVGERVRS